MDKKKQITKEIKEKVNPYLKQVGFEGTFPHYKKIVGDTMYFVGFQFGQSSLSGKIIVNFRLLHISKMPDWLKQKPENKLNFGHGDLGSSHRLGSPKKGVDGIWFDYENGDQQEISKQILELLKVELPEYLSKN